MPGGRYGVDHPERDCSALDAPVAAEAREELVEQVSAGQDVVLDHGLWTRIARNEWKGLVEGADGRPQLRCFSVSHGKLLRCLAERNERGDVPTVPESALDDFHARFGPPHNEGEEIIEPDSFRVAAGTGGRRAPASGIAGARRLSGRARQARTADAQRGQAQCTCLLCPALPGPRTSVAPSLRQAAISALCGAPDPTCFPLM
ncbi:hypothetical protein SUDANB6_05787 [Streptomyces sp. enrichment culture]